MVICPFLSISQCSDKTLYRDFATLISRMAFYLTMFRQNSSITQRAISDALQLSISQCSDKTNSIVSPFFFFKFSFYLTMFRQNWRITTVPFFNYRFLLSISQCSDKTNGVVWAFYRFNCLSISQCSDKTYSWNWVVWYSLYCFLSHNVQTKLHARFAKKIKQEYFLSHNVQTKLYVGKSLYSMIKLSISQCSDKTTLLWKLLDKNYMSFYLTMFRQNAENNLQYDN